MSPEKRQSLNRQFFEGVEWKSADERGEIARKLFAEVLKFQEVQLFTDLSKEEVIHKLNWLKEQADMFEKNKQGNETLSIGITWIGHKLQADYDPHNRILTNLGVERPKCGKDGSEYL